MKEYLRTKIDRRHFVLSSAALFFSLAGFAACKEDEYVRPWGDLDLGDLKTLFFERVYVKSRAVRVFRDEKGWRALSTRCSNDGCELAFAEDKFTCSCCKSIFDGEGRVLEGPAKKSLPWMKIRYAEGHLYGNPGEPVDASYRYTTPEIEEGIRLLRERIKKENVPDRERLPRLLLEGD